MKTILPATLLFATLLMSQSLSGQLKQVFQYTEDDGLAGNIIHDISKDQNGILWLATESGISRFDGAVFRNLHKTDGLPSNVVWAVEVSEDNVVYAGCYQIGLAVIKNDSVTGTIHTRGRYPDSFRHLLYSRTYHRLFAGTNYGMFMLHDSVLVPVDFPKDPKKKCSVMSITESNGHIFFTTSTTSSDLCGLYELYPDTVNPEESYARMISLHGRNGTAVLDGRLFSSEYNKIFTGPLDRLSSQSLSVIDSTFAIWTMAPVSDSVLLLGGYWEGRFKGSVLYYDVNKKKEYLPPFKVNLQTVYDIYVDSTKNVTWLASDNGLTSVFDSPFEYYEFGNVGNILDIGFSGDSLLVLTKEWIYYMKGNELVPVLSKNQIYQKISAEKKKVIAKYGRKSVSILDKSRSFELIRFNSMGRRLYVCSADGAVSVPDLKKYAPLGNETFLLIDDYNAATVNKFMNVCIFCTFNDHLTLTYPRLYASFLMDVFKIIESNGVFYFASTYNGLYAKNGMAVQCIDETNSVMENNITDIVRNGRGDVWCTSANGSLYQVDFRDSLRVVRHLDPATSGINGNSCKWLFFNNGNLFISTDKGLNVISEESLYSENPQIERFYNKYNGFDFISARSPVSDRAGNMYVFTPDRIIKVTPIAMTSPEELKIEVRNLQINSKRSSVERLFEKTLPYSTKSIHFEFFAVKYPAARNQSYQYRVNGGVWFDSNEINLQSLRQGSYEILMDVLDKETNRHFSKSVTINIATPFWLKWWFLLLCAITIALAFLLVMRIRINRLKRFHEEKAALISRNSELKLRSLQLQMSPHFIFNALTSVQKFIMTKSAEEALVYLGNLASIIRTNLQNASEEYIHLSYELDFLKKYIEVEKMRFKDKLAANFTTSLNDENIMLPPMLVQPVIENSIKHGIRNLEGVGVVNVDFSCDSDILVVTIEDNGVGREFTRSLSIPGHKSLGLGVIRQRLDLLNEKTQTDVHRLEIEDLMNDGKPAGTRVRIFLSVVRGG